MNAHMRTEDKLRIVVISGATASGKDTITHALESIPWSRLVYFQKHKGVDNVEVASSEERNANYHLVSHATYRRMAKNGAFLEHHERYGNGYGVSIDGLRICCASGMIPIVHNGAYHHLRSFFEHPDVEVMSILLWASRETTHTRLLARNGGDEQDAAMRLAAYDEEMQEIRSHGHLNAFTHWAVNTESFTPEEVANGIFDLTETRWLDGPFGPSGLEQNSAMLMES